MNIIFPAIKDGELDAPCFNYTNSFYSEGEPCLDCITDCNNDGRIDFIKWIKPGDDDRIYLNNFSEKGRKRWYSGYRVRFGEEGYYFEQRVRWN